MRNTRRSRPLDGPPDPESPALDGIVSRKPPSPAANRNSGMGSPSPTGSAVRPEAPFTLQFRASWSATTPAAPGDSIIPELRLGATGASNSEFKQPAWRTPHLMNTAGIGRLANQMASLLQQARKFAKRPDRFMALRHKLNWKIHILKDYWGTKIWTRTSVTVTPLNFKLRAGFHPAYDQMRAGTFEVEETAILTALLPQVGRFVDIGANLGYYSCLARSLGIPVIAFEPQAQNLACLLDNFLANGWEDNVEVLPIALSRKPGILTMYGASGPSASLVKNWAGYSAQFKQCVPTSTLDNMLSGRDQDEQLLIKIDVEGAEAQVLKGAIATMRRRKKPAWLVEICLNEFHPDGSNPDFLEIFTAFSNEGYNAFTATLPMHRIDVTDIERWVLAGKSQYRTFNYVFLARDATFNLPGALVETDSDASPEV